MKMRDSMQPLASDIPNVGQEHDEAKGGWNITALEQMLTACDNQPQWRERADYAWGYIDGKQFSQAQEAAMRKEGLSDLRPTNLIARTYRSMLGTEAKSRTDVKVDADEDEESDVCEVLNGDMKEARRETKADMAVSGAYAGQVGIGVGWVKVDRDPDPLNYPHRVRMVDRRKIWWDWHAQDPLLRDARWLVHKEWADLDELEAAMPEHKETLRNCAGGWKDFTYDLMGNDNAEIVQVADYRDYQHFSRTRQRTEWFDSGRKRIKIYEVWYRVPAMAVVLWMSPTRRVLFDEKNQGHINAVMSGKFKISKTLSSQVRCSMFAGPHRLQDIGTRRRHFPYVPFFGYRDDQDGSPYGLVEGMIGPQDEYNARRLRINWLLRARQMFIDNDALDEKANTLEEVASMLMRPDLNVVRNANRRNPNAIEIGNNLQMQQEQIEIMQDAKQLLQDQPGVYGSQLGQAASGVTSGIANSLLIEQGAIAQGDLNDNYRDSRSLVHENLLDQLIEDRSAPEMKTKIGRGSARRVVILNHWQSPEEQAQQLQAQGMAPEQIQQEVDPAGQMVNGVYDANVRVGLGEVPSTPSYRMMQQQQVATVIQALAGASPQAAAVMAPAFVEMTDLPDRMEQADNVRRALGIPTAGDKQAQQAAQQQQEQAQKQQQALAEQAMQLDLQQKAIALQKTASEVELNEAKTFQIGHDAGMDQVKTAQGAVSSEMQLGHQERDQAFTAQQAANEPPQPDPEAERQRLIDEAMQEALAA